MTRSSKTNGETKNPTGKFRARYRSPRCATTTPRRSGRRARSEFRSHRSEQVAVIERRGATRSWTAIRFPEPNAIAMPPHRRAGAQSVSGDHLVLAALFLRIKDVAVYREG